MPELSRFRGIIVKMLYRDYGKHNKPHIHAYYGAVAGQDPGMIAPLS